MGKRGIHNCTLFYSLNILEFINGTLVSKFMLNRGMEIGGCSEWGEKKMFLPRHSIKMVIPIQAHQPDNL